ncbi:MAG: T9SS type A sorting domain-containing protein [bacterium]
MYRYATGLAIVLMSMLVASPSHAQKFSAWTISGGLGKALSSTGSSITATLGQPVIGKSGGTVAGFWGVELAFDMATNTVDPIALPLKWEIGTAYPNPFNPSTTVAINLPLAARVHAEVYNVLGRRVAVLADGTLPAGKHRLIWNAFELASGVYFLRAEVPGKMHRIQKIVLVR